MRKDYIDFIRYTIHPEMDVPLGTKDIDWSDFMAFCNRQNVLGVVIDGMDRSHLSIPSNVVFEWFSYVENIKNRNLLMNKRSCDVTDYFREKGLRSCIIKGQANAQMYPHPELRSPGDIDIWVEGDAVDIIKTVLKVFPRSHYSIHHVKFPLFKDVSIEVHYRPVYLCNWHKDVVLQRYIRTKEEEQFDHQMEMGSKLVGTLTNDFNLVFQMLHMYNHFFSSRNNLKQMIDYYYLLKKWFTDTPEKDRVTYADEISNLFKELGVDKYASGVMWVLKDGLGLEDKYLLTVSNPKIGEIVLNELMNSGVSVFKSKVVLLWNRFKDNIKLIRYFPTEVLLNPFFLIWHQWWKSKMKWSLKRV